MSQSSFDFLQQIPVAEALPETVPTPEELLQIYPVVMEVDASLPHTMLLRYGSGVFLTLQRDHSLKREEVIAACQLLSRIYSEYPEYVDAHVQNLPTFWKQLAQLLGVSDEQVKDAKAILSHCGLNITHALQFLPAAMQAFDAFEAELASRQMAAALDEQAQERQELLDAGLGQTDNAEP